MSEHTFYARGRNKGNERKVILSTATLLVGKAPTKQKRIKLKLRMPLSGRAKLAGTPEWITAAHTFVAQNHDVVCPSIEFKGFDIQFSDDSLFSGDVKSPKCSMRGFEIAESGDSEQPDIDMTFTVYAPFSTALWEWVGQYAGEEMWAKFEQGEIEEESASDDLELTGDEEESETEEEPDEEEAEE